MIDILKLKNETISDTFFPEVHNYISKKIYLEEINPINKITTKQEVYLDNDNIFTVPTIFDILDNIEINGILNWEYCYGETNKNIKYINKIFDNIEIFINDRRIIKCYITDFCIDITNNPCKNTKFNINLDLKNIFLNGYLRISDKYNIKVKINNLLNNPIIIGNNNKFNYFINCSILLDDNIKNKIFNQDTILYKETKYYQNKIYKHFDLIIINSDEVEMNFCNFIKSIRINFGYIDIKKNLNFIEIHGPNDIITTLIHKDLYFINNHEFIIENFFYKLFLFNKVTLRFNIDENKFCNTHNIDIYITNYNLLLLDTQNIEIPKCKAKFQGLDRIIEIVNNNLYSYNIINNILFYDKVKERISRCCITLEQFIANEDIIICGKCLASFKKNSIEMWWKTKKDRVCPYARCVDQEWFTHKLDDYAILH